MTIHWHAQIDEVSGEVSVSNSRWQFSIDFIYFYLFQWDEFSWFCLKEHKTIVKNWLWPDTFLGVSRDSYSKKKQQRFWASSKYLTASKTPICLIIWLKIVGSSLHIGSFPSNHKRYQWLSTQAQVPCSRLEKSETYYSWKRHGRVVWVQDGKSTGEPELTQC